MFPSHTFRLAYDALCGWRGERADVEYVRILHLAATTMESKVDRALGRLLESGTEVRLRDGAQAVGPYAASSAGVEATRQGGPGSVRPAAGGRCTMMVDTHSPSAVAERVRDLCRQFNLPTLAAETVGRFSDAGHADALPTLVEVLEQEAEDRRVRRVDRLRRASKLPAGKTWDTFEHALAPVKLRQQLERLGEGDFVDRGVNVLAFGMPGTGKTHAMCSIGHRLVESGRSVLFVPAYRLVQDMLAAKRDLELPRMLRKLDNFDLLVIDDLGYLPQGAEESEVLFTLIAERYERRSLGITSNLVFSEWEKVFANPMATAAAIDRIVHHSVILEFDLPSYRTNVAQNRRTNEESDRQK